MKELVVRLLAIISILLVHVVLFASLVPSKPSEVMSVSAETEVSATVYTDGFWQYTILDEDKKTARIVGVLKDKFSFDDDSSAGATVTVPGIVGGYAVTELGISDDTAGNGVLQGLTNMKRVVIPDSVEVIGQQCFMSCYDLSTIVWSKNLREIAASAFANCSSLTSVTIPEGVITIGESAFYNCENLQSVILPSTLTTLERTAFCMCIALEEVVLPGRLTSIGDGVFYECSALESVVVEEGITSLPYAMFVRCTSLQTVDLPQSLQCIGASAFLSCSVLENMILPADLQRIETCAFRNCASLKEITLPEGLTTLGAGAFEGCTSLTGITLSEALTAIEATEDYPLAFPDVEGLIIVIPEGLEDISGLSLLDYGNVIFEVAEGSSVAVYFQENNITNIIIVNDTTPTEAPDTTEEQKQEEAVTAPVTTEEQKQEEAVTTPVATEEPATEEPAAQADQTVAYKIGKTYTKGRLKYKITSKTTATFVGAANKKITKLTIPATVKFGGTVYKVTVIAKNACKGYKKLKSVTIGKNVKTIKACAFMNCTALTKITFGAGVVTIGKKVLYGAKNLKTVTFKTKKLKSIGKKTFRKVGKKVTIKVPKGKMASYKKLVYNAK